MLFSGDEFFKKVFFYFEKLFVISISLALACWPFVLLGVLPAFTSIDGLIPQLGEAAYDVHLFCVKQNVYDSFRFYGPYDEPGVVGTFCALILVCHRFNLTSFSNIILCISGILSFSLFFYLISIVYIIYNTLKNKKLTPLIVGIFVILFLYNHTKDNDIFNWYVWRRFTYDKSEEKFVGDSRSSYQLDSFYDSIKYSKEYWFGLDDWDSFANRMSGESTYKNIVLKNGMLFFSCYLTFFILYAFHYRNNIFDYSLFLFVFIGCIYQRTNLYDPVTLSLFMYISRYFSKNIKISNINEKHLIHRRL